MTLAVVDASVVLAFLIDRPGEPLLDHLLPVLVQHGGAAPAIWHWEVVNAMLRNERAGRLRAASMTAALAMLDQIPLAVETEDAEAATARLLPLARAERLSLFDAAYLDLALRSGLPLATLDGGLASAAARHGVALLPLMP
jgi:predicted nucleic acid-binding protein